jgi:putative flippase GtrA
MTRLIPERHRSLVKELVTFGMVGGVNTALGQILFNVFFGLGALTANTISTAVATVCSFLLNRHITYRHRVRTSLRRELPLFVGLNLIGLCIQLGILDGSRQVFDLDSADRLGLNIARFGGVIVGTVFLLITYRTFVFKKQVPIEELAVDVLTDDDVLSSDDVLADDALVDEVPATEKPAVGVPTQAKPSDTSEFDILTEPLEAELAVAEDDEPATIHRT